MNWHSLGDFLDMGGYALYVWGAYGMTALAIAWELAMLAQRRQRAVEDLRAWRLIDGEADDTAA